MSTLQVLDLSRIGVTGRLPSSLGYGLPSIEGLYLAYNYFTGVIPDTISNCSKLRELTLGWNQFTSTPPYSLGNLPVLERLSLNNNHLTSESELSFITSLTNCKYLSYLSISNNPLHGIIPSSIANLSTSMLRFNANNCKIKGSIPVEIGNLTNLIELSLGYNRLIDHIPQSIEHLHKLQLLFLRRNEIRGSIPKALCNLSNLYFLILDWNQFSGPIPNCLGNVISLRHIYLGFNRLTSSIPPSIWLLKDLLELNFSSNFLTGFLPEEIDNLVGAINIDLSKNQFLGDIPSTLGKLENLVQLSLGHNKLHGIIPNSLGGMINLQTLDLSCNNLFGQIPISLQQLQHLKYFNVSFNALSGEIPMTGPFENFTSDFFKGNDGLCGIARFHVHPCHATPKDRSRRKTVFILVGVFFGIVGLCLIAIVIIRYRRKDKTANIDSGLLTPQGLGRISYNELLRGTENFSEGNLLGVGSFGSVYKGVLENGKILAIKVFNLRLEGTFKSFDVECEVLRNIRHRNLTKVVGSCSNMDFKALLLEYMPNGSLEKWLYSHNYCLNVKQRLNIMIDVAFALEYLHHGYTTPVVHCDLKPSNVLLDEEMTAHLSDFGIAKLLGEGESIVHTDTLATLGYIAPEYGLEGAVSTRCDVYSYGIMLMETFTRKKPSDEMFAGDMSIKTWVEGLFHESSSHVIDANLLNSGNLEKTLKCTTSVLELALKCSTETPKDRMNMKEVAAELQKIKREILA